MIYLDNNATTQPLPSVVDAMLPYFTTKFGNASSSTAAATGADVPHRNASLWVARLLSAEPEEIIFTSGATESNNWVLSAIGQGLPGQVVISAVEHPSVVEPAQALKRFGFEIIEVPVDSNGQISGDELKRHLSDSTRLVSIMAANNETGVVQPIEELSCIARKFAPNALFHTDATQAVGRVRIVMDGTWDNVHLLSFSAHKFGGPKGSGVLYMREGVELPPMFRGGGQERGLRAGTTNTPILAGLAKAAECAISLPYDVTIALRDSLESTLRERFPRVVIHSFGALRLPNTTCAAFPGFHGPDLVAKLAMRGIIVSTGSACSNGSLAPPRTLRAMGIDHDLAWASVRISTCPSNSKVDLDLLVNALSLLMQTSS